MHVFPKSLLALAMAGSMWAGGLRLEVGNPSANPEAAAKGAVLVVRITACQSPEKTTITATAEGIVDGSRRTVPLSLVSLSAPGTFAVARQWPAGGRWAIKMTATNPDYKNYATGVIVLTDKNSFDWASVKHVYHAPTDAEVDGVLGKESVALAH